MVGVSSFARKRFAIGGAADVPIAIPIFWIAYRSSAVIRLFSRTNSAMAMMSASMVSGGKIRSSLARPKRSGKYCLVAIHCRT